MGIDEQILSLLQQSGLIGMWDFYETIRNSNLTWVYVILLLSAVGYVVYLSRWLDLRLRALATWDAASHLPRRRPAYVISVLSVVLLVLGIFSRLAFAQVSWFFPLLGIPETPLFQLHPDGVHIIIESITGFGIISLLCPIAEVVLIVDAQLQRRSLVHRLENMIGSKDPSRGFMLLNWKITSPTKRSIRVKIGYLTSYLELSKRPHYLTTCLSVIEIWKDNDNSTYFDARDAPDTTNDGPDDILHTIETEAGNKGPEYILLHFETEDRRFWFISRKCGGFDWKTLPGLKNTLFVLERVARNASAMNLELARLAAIPPDQKAKIRIVSNGFTEFEFECEAVHF